MRIVWLYKAGILQASAKRRAAGSNERTYHPGGDGDPKAAEADRGQEAVSHAGGSGKYFV